MKLERYIARRYLFSGQNRALVSLITIISIAGVTLGVMALIVVIAVMDGFDANLREKIIGAQAHIEVARRHAQSPAITTGSLEQIRQIPGVTAAGPVAIRYGLVQVMGEGNETRQAGIIVHGINLEEEAKVTKYMSNVRGQSKPGPYEIVLGSGVAEQLMIEPGQQLRMIAPVFVDTGIGSTPLMRDTVVTGTFTTHFPETDNMYAYTSLDNMDLLFMVPPGQVDGLRIMVKNPNEVGRVAADVERIMGPQINVTTWETRNKMLFNALVMEKWAMFIILLLIVLVAAFNIIGTLTMVVTDKTREIGILKGMGATEGAIMRVFLNQGLMIGGAGTILGGALGVFTCWLLKNHISIPELEVAYMSKNIPVLLDPVMVLLITGSAMVIVLLASLYPARQAARLDPVEALRYE